MVGSKAHSYATESCHKSVTLLEMSSPPHFNPAESLLPDVKGSIGGVQGGGGGQTTFLKDILIALKGSTIQYKNPNDTDAKSYVVSDIAIESKSEPAATATATATTNSEPAATTIVAATAAATLDPAVTKDPLNEAKESAIKKIVNIEIKDIKLKRYLRNAVDSANNISDINELVSLIPNLNNDNIANIKVAVKVTMNHTNKSDLITHIIKILRPVTL